MRVIKVLLAFSILTLSATIVVAYYSLLRKSENLRFEHESLILLANKLKDVERLNNRWVGSVDLEIEQFKAQRDKATHEIGIAESKYRVSEQTIIELRAQIAHLENEYGNCLMMYSKLYGVEKSGKDRKNAITFMKELDNLIKEGNFSTNGLIDATDKPISVEYFVEMPKTALTGNQPIILPNHANRT